MRSPSVLAADDGRLPEAVGVDAVGDRAHGLLDRGLPELFEAILPHRHVDDQAVGRGAAQVVEVIAEPLVVEAIPVRLVGEGDANASAPDALDGHALLHLGELVAAGRVDVVVIQDAEQHAELTDHLLRIAVATVANVFVDLDLVHQAEAALDVQTGVDATGEDVPNPLRGRCGEVFAVVGEAVEARPEREPSGRDSEEDDRETEIPGTIHRRVA